MQNQRWEMLKNQSEYEVVVRRDDNPTKIKPTWFKGTVMQIEKALTIDRSCVSKVFRKFRIPTIYNFAVIYPWILLFFWKVAYFLTVSIVFPVYKKSFTAQ